MTQTTTEEQLDTSLITLASLSYLVVKNEVYKFSLIKRIHQLGPLIIEKGSKLIQLRFILLAGYYLDILAENRVSNELHEPLLPEREERSLSFEEVVMFL